MQFAFYVANQEITKRKAAEAIARKTAEIKDLTTKEREELTRFRGKQSSKHKEALKKSS